ncbi:MAG: fumarylacetoacetate hydrolase family protein [Alphaproteobacteria bacterium]|nr:fumarylacetoacetate hydrolase family protein [Alphaproteobacteria bacterium]
MKLLRYGPAGKERPALIDGEGRLRDLSKAIGGDLTSATLSPALIAKIRKLDPRKLPAVKGKPRLGTPVGAIGKVVCIGLNYADHAKESGMPIPAEPIIFLKANTAITGPNDPVSIPRNSVKTDWECELAVVIGKKAKYVEEKDSFAHVAGYTICNDVSERDFQLARGGTWTKGKSHDSFAPIGPWLVTADEIKDPQDLSMWLEVSGVRRQNGSTRTMIFGVRKLVSYVSQFMTLMPGDIISTGTPPGVGSGIKPPVFLKPGDTMRLGIQGLGEQNQKVVAAK